MIKGILQKLALKQDLTEEEAEEAFDELINDPEPVDIATFLTLLKSKGEKWPEIVGIVRALRKKMIKIELDLPLLDIVGTGGDGAATVNISTGSAILAASCGVFIAKHGNRSISSLCGSADLIECLGIDLVKDPELIKKQIVDLGIAFLFAPHFNPVMKMFHPIRQRVGFRTVMNILGPLLNPAEAEYLMVGVWDESLIEVIAKALLTLNIKKGIVFSGNTLDELSTVGKTKALYIEEGSIRPFIFDPEQLGFKLSPLESLRGGSPEENKKLLLETLDGKEGPIADTLVLNAGAALWLYGKVGTLQEGIDLARTVLAEKMAAEKLNQWIQFEKSNVG